jgi:hypothetical protein
MENLSGLAAYRRMAARCRELAERTDHFEHNDALQALAREWEALADQVEHLERAVCGGFHLRHKGASPSFTGTGQASLAASVWIGN